MSSAADQGPRPHFALPRCRNLCALPQMVARALLSCSRDTGVTPLDPAYSHSKSQLPYLKNGVAVTSWTSGGVQWDKTGLCTRLGLQQLLN